jgi:hypothetical protein
VECKAWNTVAVLQDKEQEAEREEDYIHPEQQSLQLPDLRLKQLNKTE